MNFLFYCCVDSI